MQDLTVLSFWSSKIERERLGFFLAGDVKHASEKNGSRVAKEKFPLAPPHPTCPHQRPIASAGRHPCFAAAATTTPCAGSQPTGRAARWPRPCGPPPPTDQPRRRPSLRRRAIQLLPWGRRRWRWPWPGLCPRPPRERPQCR